MTAIASPSISLIIPTHNRAERLRQTLEAVRAQTLAPDRFEVIVVDDGGTDATAQVVQCGPPHWRYVRQEQQGATQARNRGATAARSSLLVFMDDDIEPGPPVLEMLADLHQRHARAVIVGTFARPDQSIAPSDALARVPFTECYTGLLSVRAADFAAVGQFQDVTGGWPNWDDVFFGYRAEQAGLTILRSSAAWAVHYDETAQDLDSTARRYYRASISAARLFARYPDIQPRLPMYADMLPADWKQDGPKRIARKGMRRMMSTWLVLRALAAAAKAVERVAPRSRLLYPLHRWIVGGHIYQGYRQGLKDL